MQLLMLAQALVPLLVTAPDSAVLRLLVDSARHEVVIEIRLPDAPHHVHHDAAGGPAESHAAHEQYFVPFAWPVNGWVRGAAVDLIDPAGATLPQAVLHHINLLNLDRRLLLYDGIERLWAGGSESRPVLLPRTVGIPLAAGSRLGVVVALSATDRRPGTTVRLRITWTQATLSPRPVSAYPVGVDVNYRPGLTAAYDLPAGPSEQSAEFVMPIGGRVLGIGGHLHQYGRAVRLEDAETGRTVFELRPRSDSAGRILGMPTALFGIRGRGRPLQAGHRYRIVAVYDNPTGEIIRDGAMGEMALLFVPDRPEAWPTLDGTSEGVVREVAVLSGLRR